MRRLVALTLLGLTQCAPPADEAVILLHITLPYEDGDRPIAAVQVNRDDGRFDFGDATWVTPRPETFDLRESNQIELAVRTKHPDVESVAHLRVRITLCETNSDRPCQGDAATPELQFLLEHPFYAGELTEWRAGPADAPDAYHLPDSVLPSRQEDMPRQEPFPVVIDHCSIAGCIELVDKPGAAWKPNPETGFCERRGDELVHFCAEGS